MTSTPDVSATCAHCGQPALGFATRNDDRLCHDDARDCYELVTVHQHPTPCTRCISAELDQCTRNAIADHLESMARELHRRADETNPNVNPRKLVVNLGTLIDDIRRNADRIRTTTGETP